MSLTRPREVTWATLVRDLLYRSGFGDVWLNQRVVNKDLFLEEFKQRIKDMYLQEWIAEVRESSEGRLFKHIKREFKFEKYLDGLWKAQRISLTRIRLSSHIFNIERGRWGRVGGRNRINREDRLCNQCGVIECEFHCIVQCPRYLNEREGRLPTRLRNRPCICSSTDDAPRRHGSSVLKVN